MKLYLLSLGAGILAGVIYGLINVRSPAPPVIALIGLLGMLIGEQVVPLTSKLLKGEAITATWFSKECIPKVTGTPDSSVAPESKIASRTTDQ